ncbi:hypothetical protein Tco_0939493 [Tanacetum coccineum]|uniref:Uncharacterized protein n=1 Tax=Tanacetum coccineum TaxID=301880 RepID=A0ABQ5DMT1_9ASTR
MSCSNPNNIKNNEYYGFRWSNVGIKSLLNAVNITTAHIRVNDAQLFNAAEGVNAASEEVSTAELLSNDENFPAPSSEMLNNTFERLKKLMLPVGAFG